PLLMLEPNAQLDETAEGSPVAGDALTLGGEFHYLDRCHVRVTTHTADKKHRVVAEWDEAGDHPLRRGFADLLPAVPGLVQAEHRALGGIDHDPAIHDPR